MDNLGKQGNGQIDGHDTNILSTAIDNRQTEGDRDAFVFFLWQRVGPAGSSGRHRLGVPQLLGVWSFTKSIGSHQGRIALLIA